MQQYWLDIAYIVATAREIITYLSKVKPTQTGKSFLWHPLIEPLWTDIDLVCVQLLGAMAYVCAPAQIVVQGLTSTCNCTNDSTTSTANPSHNAFPATVLQAARKALLAFDSTMSISGTVRGTSKAGANGEEFAAKFDPAAEFCNVAAQVEDRRADQWKRRAVHGVLEAEWPWLLFMHSCSCVCCRNESESASLPQRPVFSNVQRLALVKSRPEFNHWVYSGMEYPTIVAADIENAMMVVQALVKVPVDGDKEQHGVLTKQQCAVVDMTVPKYEKSLQALVESRAAAVEAKDAKAQRQNDKDVEALWAKFLSLLRSETILD